MNSRYLVSFCFGATFFAAGVCAFWPVIEIGPFRVVSQEIVAILMGLSGASLLVNGFIEAREDFLELRQKGENLAAFFGMSVSLFFLGFFLYFFLLFFRTVVFRNF